MSISDPDELSRKLSAWKVEPQIPTGFQREVWQRIAARQATREDAFAPALLRWLSLQLVRPVYAVTLFALLLGSGVSYAHMQAQESNARNWRVLEARYADSVNPLAMAR
jgi:hypothetical protein